MTRPLAAAVALLGAEAARAEEGWRGYASLGAGVAMHSSELTGAMGPTLQLHLGVESPVGLSLGATLEGLNAWGDKEPIANGGLGRRKELSARTVGLEARMHFARGGHVSPWLGARVGYSFAESLVPRFQGSSQWVSLGSQGPGFALRAGLDWRLNERWSLSTSGSAQWCDVRVVGGDTEECVGPLFGFLVGPAFRF